MPRSISRAIHHAASRIASRPAMRAAVIGVLPSANRVWLYQSLASLATVSLLAGQGYCSPHAFTLASDRLQREAKIGRQ